MAVGAFAHLHAPKPERRLTTCTQWCLLSTRINERLVFHSSSFICPACEDDLSQFLEWLFIGPSTLAFFQVSLVLKWQNKKTLLILLTRKTCLKSFSATTLLNSLVSLADIFFTTSSVCFLQWFSQSTDLLVFFASFFHTVLKTAVISPNVSSPCVLCISWTIFLTFVYDDQIRKHTKLRWVEFYLLSFCWMINNSDYLHLQISLLNVLEGQSQSLLWTTSLKVSTTCILIVDTCLVSAG